MPNASSGTCCFCSSSMTWSAALRRGPGLSPYWLTVSKPNSLSTRVTRAATGGHQVIMSPADRSYLDMKYDKDTPLGLDWAGVVGVERSYDWDPADRLPGVG